MIPTPATTTVLSALDAHHIKPKTTPRGWECRCPAHDDRMPSLGVLQGDNSCAILSCAAGCRDTDIIAALGLSTVMHRGDKGGWFLNENAAAPAPYKNGHAARERKTHPTLAGAMDAARYGASIALDLPKEQLIFAGQWPYKDATGRVVAVVVRFNLPPRPGEKARKHFVPIHTHAGGWRVGDPSQWPLYHLPEVIAAIKAGRCVWWCEGEKAADALATLGLATTTTAHGAKSPQKSDFTPLVGCDELIILPDNDAQARDKDGNLRFLPNGEPLFVGLEYARDIARRAMAVAPLVKVGILMLPGLPPKGDAVEWIAGYGDAPTEILLAELERLVAACPVLTEPPPLSMPPTTTALTAVPAAPPPIPTDALIVLEPPDPPIPEESPMAAASRGQPWILRDLGNAHRFCHQHAATCRYDVRSGFWRVWDGTHWAADTTETAVYAMAEKTVKSLLKEADACPTAGTAQDIAKWAAKSHDRPKIESMLVLASKQAAITPNAMAWDADPYTFNCKNGTIQLRTSTLRDHNPADLITCLSPAKYDPAAESELMLRSLAQWHDQASHVLFLQQAAGYSLTGDVSEEKLFLIHGPPAAGKSTFIEMMKVVLGTYSRTADFESFLKRSMASGGGARGDLARLAGARFVSSVESEEGKELAEGLIKGLTGGDTITTRHLYKAEFEFRPQFKLWFVTNHAPHIDPDDAAMWRRVIKIPFDQTIPIEKRNRKLKAQLIDVEQTGAAFLAWAVLGCREWLENGLMVPPSLDKSTSELREEMDSTVEFFEECLDFGTTGHHICSWNDIAAAYDGWCKARFLPNNRRLGNTKMARRLRSKGADVKRDKHSRCWTGVSIKLK